MPMYDEDLPIPGTIFKNAFSAADIGEGDDEDDDDGMSHPPLSFLLPCPIQILNVTSFATFGYIESPTDRPNKKKRNASGPLAPGPNGEDRVSGFVVDGDGDQARRKIRIEYIEDRSRRHITFSKRKAGIMKKVGKKSFEELSYGLGLKLIYMSCLRYVLLRHMNYLP